MQIFFSVKFATSLLALLTGDNSPIKTENAATEHCKGIFFFHGQGAGEILMNKTRIWKSNIGSILSNNYINGQISRIEDFHASYWVATCVKTSYNDNLEKETFTFN